MSELDFTFTIRRRPTIADRIRKAAWRFTAGAAIFTVGLLAPIHSPFTHHRTASATVTVARRSGRSDDRILVASLVPANAISRGI